jgi:hypothetical protein
VSPLYRVSETRLMSATALEAKTFNNRLVLERGLWKRKSRQFECVPKRSVFGAILRTH